MTVTAKHIIRRWYERYEDEVESTNANDTSGVVDELIFDQFIYLWISFNGSYESIFYQDRHHVSDSNGRSPAELTLVLNAVQFCYRNNPDFHSAVRVLLISPEVKFFSEQNSSDDYAGFRVLDVYGSISSLNHSAKEGLRNSDNSDLDRIRAMAALLYRVRCNLFHGKKGPKSQKDVEIIRNSIKPLSVITAAAMEMVYD